MLPPRELAVLSDSEGLGENLVEQGSRLGIPQNARGHSGTLPLPMSRPNLVYTEATPSSPSPPPPARQQQMQTPPTASTKILQIPHANLEAASADEEVWCAGGRDLKRLAAIVPFGPLRKNDWVSFEERQLVVSGEYDRCV